ncbi:MAG TPA: hypothetical protein VGP90_12925, partial [Acidimicrobiia bacterium]|nr:hypothetical protein [Acidimicrobiia bacterium]
MSGLRERRALGALGMALAMLVTAAGCGRLDPPASPADPADASAGHAGGPEYATVGALVADAGFRPTAHGFGFENYGTRLADGSTATNMTADDVRAMFGDAVCADLATGRCDLMPAAQAWLDSTNEEMGNGHCYGFSVAAQLLWQRKADAGAYGASRTPQLDITDNDPLQRRIAYDWALQLLDSVRSGEVTGTPNEILARLRKVLRPDPPETYTVAIFKPDWTGGHAVTPYAVENRGGGRYNVLIYDNNWPGTTRAIAFDTRADTWTYDAAINPNRPDELYHGNAKTKTISLFPTSPGLGPQHCPFCAKRPRRAPLPANAIAAMADGKETAEIYLD